MSSRTCLLFAVSFLALDCAGAGPAPPGPGHGRTPSIEGGIVERHSPTCRPRFPLEQGWLGGDAVYSVPLPDASGEQPTLWLFGDSFVGAPAATHRRGAAFVHNTVARSRCRADGRFEIDYFWREAEDGSPRAIFETGEAGRFFWPFDGVVFEGTLYVALVLVASAEAGAGGLPFEVLGVDLARIANPGDDPRRWRIETRPLSRAEGRVPAGAMLVEHGFLHLFGFLEWEGGRRPRFLARLSLDALRRFDATLPGALEILRSDGRWIAGLESHAPRILMEDDATEMSVAREPGNGRLRAVYSFPYQGGAGITGEPSAAVYTRTAERPEGPWSQPRVLFVVPDLGAETVAKLDPARRCYAAKAHPTFGTVERMVVTYACNLLVVGGEAPGAVMERLRERLEEYRPVVVSWPRPDPPGYERDAQPPTDSPPGS
ncbi:MAG: DUF4185 domain-containing protein [Deltaproteobacteria bacterium]|jgi:hypothetical protein|nr:DUF4185 domain-containing protein [Deltaproteobacteria bacterium]MBW2496028.1 DUF4185 domain-containing protein [Deltaproteobacteria bacterium]